MKITCSAGKKDYFKKESLKKRLVEVDTLNGLIQKINSKKPRGTLKPNYSIPKTAAKRVISGGLIAIDYSLIIPADQSNYTVLLICFSLFEDYIQKWKSLNMDLMPLFLKSASLIILFFCK